MALPIYTSDLSHLTVLEGGVKNAKLARQKVRKSVDFIGLRLQQKQENQLNTACVCLFQRNAAKKQKKQAEEVKKTEDAAEGKEEKVEEEEKKEEDEEIPHLVPTATPSKKPKLEVCTTCSR